MCNWDFGAWIKLMLDNMGQLTSYQLNLNLLHRPYYYYSNYAHNSNYDIRVIHVDYHKKIFSI